MKVMPPNFFSENYNYNEIYIFYGDIPYKVEIILLKVSIMNTLFSALLYKLYASCIKLFVEASEIFVHAVFWLSSSAKWCPWSAYLKGPKRWMSDGAEIKLMGG